MHAQGFRSKKQATKATARQPRRSNPSAIAGKPNIRGVDSEAAEVAANGYIVSQFPIGFLGGTPHRLPLETRGLWIVPIVLTSPGYGAVGEVGVVAIDACTGQILGGTPRRDVVAAATVAPLRS